MRLFKAAAILAAVVALNFLLIRLIPGDPASVLAGESGMADETFLAMIREMYGLDKPLLVQLKTYLLNAAGFNLGFSYPLQRDVIDIIIERLPATLALTGSAFLISLVVGVGLGVWAGSRSNGPVDRLINVVVLAFYATPGFWVGLMLILIFSVWLRWLPASGTGFETGDDPGALVYLKHLCLPVVTLALYYVAVYFRLCRTSVISVLHQDFVRTARSKGLSWRAIMRRHVLPNAILPVFTMAALQAGSLVSGSIAIETIFAWPGVGRLGYEALMQRDYNLLLGVFLTTAAMVVLLNVIADILYAVVDPRIEVAR
ncbi:ABC transporter permease [Boseaceae bacterium BT-24-1]|nr:ABC transporter permease [Boseaceae bacterium BT-24-1]